MSTQNVSIQELSTGYYRAQGAGPCEWAQWRKGSFPTDADFFPEASAKFRSELMAELRRREESR